MSIKIEAATRLKAAKGQHGVDTPEMNEERAKDDLRNQIAECEEKISKCKDKAKLAGLKTELKGLQAELKDWK
jgi:hypothetical protein